MQNLKNGTDLFKFVVESSLDTHLFFSLFLVIILFIVGFVLVIWSFLRSWRAWQSFEIDQVELGVGDQRVSFRPNSTDQQIAYNIWVEIKTRKIGLEIDLDNDVILEIYDSWYDFFSITREMIKDVPVSKINRKSTQKIIKVSIDILNEGLRPHLTKWQARYRRWYENAINTSEYQELTPQEIQRKFPQYDELTSDMIKINEKLMNYRDQLHNIAFGQKTK